MSKEFHSAPHELIHSGYIGSVHCGSHEILRRVFVTVRDRHWLEVAPTQWDSVIDERTHDATLRARHTSELVDFEWEGVLQASADLREVRLDFQGKALRDMEVCRLGLVVLHPLDSLVGARLTAIGPQGTQQLTVAGHIHPQPIVNGVPGAMLEPFWELTIEREDFGALDLHFGGELFELEDQRNWGDASFKTYCTPLRKGFPRIVKSGTTVAHSVKIEFEPASRSAARAVQKGKAAPAPQRVPAIGREWRASSSEASGKPPWEHLHVQVADTDAAGPLRALMKAAPTAKLQVGVEAEWGAIGSADLGAVLAEHRDRIARVLVYGAGNALPSARAVEQWRKAVEAIGSAPTIPIFAATRGYFVELNRSVPLDLPVSGVAFPLSATVHSDDEETIVDNVATVCDMAATLRHLTPSTQIALAPLALYYPAPPSPTRFPPRLVVPWVTAMIINATAAQVGSITLAEDALRGLTEAGPNAQELLTRLISLAGLYVTPLKASLSAGVHAVLLDPGQQTSVWGLAANLTAAPGRIVLEAEGMGRSTVSVTEAVTGVHLEAVRGVVEIPAFGVVWIEQV
jgi:hypothetical protein